MPASEGQHHHEGFGQLQSVTTGSYRPEAVGQSLILRGLASHVEAIQAMR